MTPLLRGEKYGERMKEARPGITYGLGNILIVSYRGMSER